MNAPFDVAAVGRGLSAMVKAELQKRDGRITALEARIARLEAAIEQKSSIKYMGVHKEGATYSEGSLVTLHGSMFHCNKQTREMPGEGSQDWVLCVKKGRDGKDATRG